MAAVVRLAYDGLEGSNPKGGLADDPELKCREGRFGSTNPLIRNSAVSSLKMFRSKEALGLPATKQLLLQHRLSG